MAQVTKTMLNLRCDCCGALLDPEQYWVEQEAIDLMAQESGWRQLGGRDYCHDCWNYDDDDHIVCKDGRKFTEDGQEINRRLNYLELSETMTLTQFATELAQGRGLFQCMVGTLYKGMLADDLDYGYQRLQELLTERKGTAEWEAYLTFQRHGIYERFYSDAIDEICNRNKTN